MKNRIWLAFALIFVVSSIVFGQTKATRTITNFELEKYKERREQSEDEYRKTYKERGLPSPEELDQQRQQTKQRNEEIIRQGAVNRQQDQNYYQIQAANLRNQILNVDGQLRYLNAQIANTPAQNSIFMSPENFYSVGVANVGRGGYRNNPQVNTVNQATSVQSVINQSAGNPNPFWGTPLYPSSIQLVIGQNNQPQHNRRYSRPYYGGYSYPVPVNNNNAQREELISRYRYLQQVRAGLSAQWNSLVEEARRAGVRIN
ncbi:MAG: hypothetical protein K1X72_20915 [Pyrinomonadaceae bacterium]|nr:hypothetical protein [Pyrinomonadaceae bacterium]